MRRLKVSTAMITVVPLVILAVATCIYLAGLAKVAIKGLPSAISMLAAQRIRGQVVVGSLDTFPGGVVLRNVKIIPKGSKSKRPILRIPLIRVTANVSDIILRRIDPVQSIERIDVIGPDVSIERLPNGRWNFADLIKPSTSKKPMTFKAKIHVQGGRVVVSDVIKATGLPTTNELSDLSGTVTFGQYIEWDVRGNGKPGRFSSVGIAGRYRSENGSLMINANLNDANAFYWSKYPFKLGLDIHSGKAQISAHIERATSKQPFHYTTDFDLNHASISFKPITRPITDISGNVRLCDGVVGIRVNGKLSKNAFHANGYVIGFHDPRLMIDAACNGADLADLVNNTKYKTVFSKVTMPHSGMVHLRIFGIPKSLAAEFDVEAPRVSYLGYNFEFVSVRGAYFDGKMRIQKATGSSYGGHVAMNGNLQLVEHPLGVFNGSVTGADLARIPFTKRLEIDGRSDGTFEALWKPGNFDVRFKASADRGTARRIPFDNGAITARYNNGKFEMRESSAHVLGGLVGASGEIDRKGDVHVHVSGADVNLARAASSYSKLPIVGRAQFYGDIGGTSANPTFNGRVEGYRVVVSGYGLDRIAGDFTASRNRVDLSRLTMYGDTGYVRIAGAIISPISKSPQLDLSVRADGFPLDLLDGKVGGMGVEGSASGTVTVSGALKNPKVAGILTAENTLVSSTSIDSAEIRFFYADKSLHVEKLEATSGAAKLTATGQMSVDKHLAFTFSASNVNAAKANRFLRPYLVVSGLADISGSVIGTTDKPHAEIKVDCPNPIVNGQKFVRLSGSASGDKNGAIVASLMLSDVASEYSLSNIKYDFVSKSLQLKAVIHDGNGTKLFQALSSSPYIRSKPSSTSGRHDLMSVIKDNIACKINADLSGVLHMKDRNIDPDLQCSAVLDDLEYGSSKVKNVQFKGSMHSGVITLEKLEAVDGDMNLSADGSLGRNGDLGLRVDAHNFALDYLRQWAKLPDNFSGRADVTLVASGKTTAPKAEMFVEFVDPVLAGIKFDRLRSILSTGDSESGSAGVRIDDVMLVQGNHSLKASGFIPMDWHAFEIPKDGSILVESQLDEGSLDIISAFTGMKFETAQGGDFGGNVKLAGTISTPLLEGSIAWKKGIIRIPKLNNVFDNVNAKVTLKGDKLTIDNIKGDSSEGGTFEVKGSMLMAAPAPVLDMSVVTRGLGISARNISNQYGEYATSKVNADLILMGSVRNPEISGKVSIPQGELSMMGKSTPPIGNPRMLPIDPKFDLTVDLGRSVEFRSSRIRTPLYGKLVVGGSLSKIMLDGTVDIASGKIFFPMRQLRIMPGSTLMMHLASPEPAKISVDMTAQGRVSSAAMTTGTAKSYTVTMTATGQIDKMNTTFNSTPPELSDQEIMGLLTGKQQLESAFGDKNLSDINKVWNAAVLPTLFQTVGNAVQDVLGVQEFGLDAGYNEPMRLTIGNQLFGGLYIDYTRVMGAKPDYSDSLQELKLSYRFKKGLELDLTTDENRMLTVGIAGRSRY